LPRHPGISKVVRYGSASNLSSQRLVLLSLRSSKAADIPQDVTKRSKPNSGSEPVTSGDGFRRSESSLLLCQRLGGARPRQECECVW
jgi:hypothetical protein